MANDEGERPSFDAWLESSCRASGVPLHIDDPLTLRTVAMLFDRPSTARPFRPPSAGRSEPGSRSPDRDAPAA